MSDAESPPADWQTTYYALLRRARTLPHGKSQVDLLEEATKLADTHQDDDRAFSARVELTSDATFSGFPERALVAFAWCRARCEKDPQRFAERRLAWNNKLILHNLMTFPQITRAQIEEALADMKRRWERLGLSLRPWHMFRAIYGMELETADMKEHFHKWWDAPRDSMSDCNACELDSKVMFFIDWERHEDALREAGPIVAGRLRCAEVPHRTLARLLLPALRLGRREEAAEYHRRGHRLIEGNLQLLQHAGSHIAYLTLEGNLTRALEIFERHLPNAVDTFDKLQRFQFYLGARMLFRKLVRDQRAHVRLNVPSAFPVQQKDGDFEVAELSRYLDAQTDDLCARFDARNGNQRLHRAIEEHEALLVGR